ncbi:hypothetical protein EJ08DRAFT_662007 [Tothia fuscella]|uniref:Uncharacterized protein n=1 Tax=Tothia fuscella TaxID=1048955 RepID=A0A9P4NPC8_9PEZI|nr:hypothetical protein EJ08DRAFT_662007 [Tothia fuscella]
MQFSSILVGVVSMMTAVTATPVPDTTTGIQVPVYAGVNVTNSSVSIASTQLDGRIDLCTEDNYSGTCIRGFPFRSWACYNYVDNTPLRSVGWGGNGVCQLFKYKACLGRYGEFKETCPDLLSYGWGDYDTASFSCYRYN